MKLRNQGCQLILGHYTLCAKQPALRANPIAAKRILFFIRCVI